MRMTLKPAAPGLLVRIPAQGFRHLRPEGEDVAMDSYWQRRLLDGDVVEVPPSEPETAPARARKPIATEKE